MTTYVARLSGHARWPMTKHCRCGHCWSPPPSLLPVPPSHTRTHTLSLTSLSRLPRWRLYRVLSRRISCLRTHRTPATGVRAHIHSPHSQPTFTFNPHSHSHSHLQSHLPDVDVVFAMLCPIILFLLIDPGVTGNGLASLPGGQLPPGLQVLPMPRHLQRCGSNGRGAVDRQMPRRLSVQPLPVELHRHSTGTAQALWMIGPPPCHLPASREQLPSRPGTSA